MPGGDLPIDNVDPSGARVVRLSVARSWRKEREGGCLTFLSYTDRRGQKEKHAK